MLIRTLALVLSLGAGTAAQASIVTYGFESGPMEVTFDPDNLFRDGIMAGTQISIDQDLLPAHLPNSALFVMFAWGVGGHFSGLGVDWVSFRPPIGVYSFDSFEYLHDSNYVSGFNPSAIVIEAGEYFHSCEVYCYFDLTFDQFGNISIFDITFFGDPFSWSMSHLGSYFSGGGGDPTIEVEARTTTPPTVSRSGEVIGVIPLPASWVLLLFPLLGLGAASWRRRYSQ